VPASRLRRRILALRIVMKHWIFTTPPKYSIHQEYGFPGRKGET